jgi:hypothetical protein
MFDYVRNVLETDIEEIDLESDLYWEG